MPDTDSDLITIVEAGTLAAAGPLGESVEAPFDAEVANVTLELGTAADADVIVDVLVNGDSIFGLTLGTVAGPSTAQAGEAGWDSDDTELLFEPAEDGAVQAGMTLLVESEEIVVTDVTGSPFVDNATSLQKLTVTRAANGTSAAAHDGGTVVTSALPRIVTGDTASTDENRGNLALVTPQIAKGDTLSAATTQIGGTAKGADLTVAILLNRR